MDVINEFTVIIPALNEMDRIADVVETGMDAGASQVLVVDGGSTDETVHVAISSGALVYDATALPPHGPSLGKGDSLWRAIPMVLTPYTVFLDGDLRIDKRFITKLVTPLTDRNVLLSKASFQRVTADGTVMGPGRVTDSVAKPLLRRYLPELAGLREPLSGQVAARTELLMRTAFEVDYGLEVGMLIDVYTANGITAIAHPDCGWLEHLPQHTDAIESMGLEVTRAIEHRLGALPRKATHPHVMRAPHRR